MSRIRSDRQTVRTRYQQIPTWLVKEFEPVTAAMANASFIQDCLSNLRMQAIVRPRFQKPWPHPTDISHVGSDQVLPTNFETHRRLENCWAADNQLSGRARQPLVSFRCVSQPTDSTTRPRLPSSASVTTSYEQALCESRQLWCWIVSLTLSITPSSNAYRRSFKDRFGIEEHELDWFRSYALSPHRPWTPADSRRQQTVRDQLIQRLEFYKARGSARWSSTFIIQNFADIDEWHMSRCIHQHDSTVRLGNSSRECKNDKMMLVFCARPLINQYNIETIFCLWPVVSGPLNLQALHIVSSEGAVVTTLTSVYVYYTT